MLYRFRDIAEIAYPGEMSVQTIFNGVNLDQTLPGFYTLSVSGREVAARDLEMQKYRSYKTCSAITSSTLAARHIEVKYAMITKCERDYIEQFEQLNAVLQKPEGRLMFTDDTGFFYEAELGTAEELNGGLYHQIGNLSFARGYPYKKAVDTESWQGGVFRKDTLFPVLLEKAEVEVATSGARFVIKNVTTGQKIILDLKEPVLAGDTLTFDFLQPRIYSKTSPNLMTGLDLLSDFEDFALENGDQVKLESGAGDKLTFTYREVRL